MSANAADSSIDASVTLVVFCRRPARGAGKRRIAAELGDARTHALANRLLATALEDAGHWPGPVVIAPASGDDAAWAAGLLPDRAEIIPQPGGNLGERLNAVDAAARAAGHERLLFIGSDAPALTPGYYERARHAMTTADVVLGPADDGGVTLMASSRPWPDLAALPWSTAGLGDALEHACVDRGLSVAQLEPRYDVDVVTDLGRLRHDLPTDPRPARRALLQYLRRIDPTVSLVIPVLDDQAALGELLKQVRRFPTPPDEIIVVDGGNHPTGIELCKRYDCIRLQTRPGRGHQLHAGAMRATGNAIWFLHADARPARDSIERIREHLAAGRIGGYFRFSFTGPAAWQKSLLTASINLRCRFGVPYGDQGLFIDREVYTATDGFADVPLFEEVHFVRAARRAGRFEPVDTHIGVSPRRWERDGWLRRTLHNRWLALGFMLGVSPERLARSYASRTSKETARC